MKNPKRDENGIRLDFVQCAWCKVYIDTETRQVVDPPEDVEEADRFSHTICEPCADGMNESLHELEHVLTHSPH